MPTQPTKGKAQFATQVEAELLEQFRGYTKERGETFSAALERAMRREMAYPPPPVEVPPLGDSPAAEAGAKPAGAGKGKGKGAARKPA